MKKPFPPPYHFCLNETAERSFIMKNKRIVHIMIFLVLAVVSAFALSACNTNSAADPKEELQNIYGNTEYRITFNTEPSTDVIEPVYYSAVSMPTVSTLPTPKRVGYVFSGWYYDPSFTTPFVNDSLYLKMCDVTLYAQWQEEEMVQDGIYDIRFEASILEDTVKLGSTTEQYGGYSDFCEAIIPEETYIEKSENGLRLRLQYRDDTTVGFFSTSNPFTVSVNSSLGTSVRLDETISSLTDVVKTLYFDITNFDYSQEFLFDILWINYTSPELTDDNRNSTATRYTVRFQIAEFIGFGSSFVDPDLPLDDGYYLVKTHFESLWSVDSSNMAERFNPVYSYILAENGRYTLIKPIPVYTGLVSDSATVDFTAYYNRFMTFMGLQAYYDITFTGNIVNNQKEYIAGHYGELVIEYHVDEESQTGSYFALFDLGNNVKQNFMLCLTVTGYMEAASAMGYTDVVMTIDYDHIVRLADFDYQPLTGDAYTYTDSFLYTPESIIGDGDSVYDESAQNGFSFSYPNFYYCAGDIGDTSGQMFSHRITIKPLNNGGSSQSIEESGYGVAHFETYHEVFGYETEQGNLYADVITTSQFNKTGLRESLQIKTGQSYEAGSYADINEIFRNKVADVDGMEFTVRAYGMSGGRIDYDREINIPTSGVIELDDYSANGGIALYYEYDVSEKTSVKIGDQATEINTKHCVVELIPGEGNEPVVRFDNASTIPDEILADTEYEIPQLVYSWNGFDDYSVYDRFYPSADGTAETFNPTSGGYYAVYEDGMDFTPFELDETTFEYVSYRGGVAQELPEKVIFAYELRNIYGEVQVYYYEISVQQNVDESTVYSIIGNGETLYSDLFDYYGDGQKQPVNESVNLYLPNAADLAENSYIFLTGGVEHEMVLSEIRAYTDEPVLVLDNISAVDSALQQLKDGIANRYAYIELDYIWNGNTLTERYLVNVTFNGETSLQIFTYDDYFTGRDYYFPVVKVCDLDGNVIGLGNVMKDFTKPSATKIESNDWVSTINFTRPGEAYFYLSVNLRYDEQNNPVFNGIGRVHIEYDETVTAIDGQGSVKITYSSESDEGILFTGGRETIEHEYSLTDNIILPGADVFENVPEGTRFFAWAVRANATSNDLYFMPNTAISDFIGQFNSDEIILYPIWDNGVRFTLESDPLGLMSTLERILYLTTSGSAIGSYVLPDLEYLDIPDEITYNGITYAFVGFTGDVFGGYMSKDEVFDMPVYNIQTSGDCVVRVVYRQIHTVTLLRTNNDALPDNIYTNSYFAPVEVIDGFMMSGSYTPVAKAGYRFVGWYQVKLDSDGNILKNTDGTYQTENEPFDFSTPISSDITLCAVFEQA